MAYLKYLRLDFHEWAFFERLWLLVFTAVNIFLFFALGDTLVGLLASLTGMLCVILVAKGKISNYSYGLLNVILYAYVSYQNKFYGEVMLNVFYFLPMQFIGLYLWEKHRISRNDVRIAKLDAFEKIYWLAFCVGGTYAYGLLLMYLGGTLPFVDSTTTILSIVAMILMVKRVAEQWLLWIIIDMVSIIMWLYAFLQAGNDVSIVVMWSAYLVNALYGYYHWKKMEAVL